MLKIRLKEIYIRSELEQKDAGFSLMELMVVTALISVLASIAFASYQSYIKKANDMAAFSLYTNIVKHFEGQEARTNLVPSTLCSVKANVIQGQCDKLVVFSMQELHALRLKGLRIYTKFSNSGTIDTPFTGYLLFSDGLSTRQASKPTSGLIGLSVFHCNGTLKAFNFESEAPPSTGEVDPVYLPAYCG